MHNPAEIIRTISSFEVSPFTRPLSEPLEPHQGGGRAGACPGCPRAVGGAKPSTGCSQSYRGGQFRAITSPTAQVSFVKLLQIYSQQVTPTLHPPQTAGANLTHPFDCNYVSWFSPDSSGEWNQSSRNSKLARTCVAAVEGSKPRRCSIFRIDAMKTATWQSKCTAPVDMRP